jgi:metal-responsive CopG/Arc/MetJ family transcriptional regulator
MRNKKTERSSVRAKGASLVRASISFPPNLYEALEEIAVQKKVSLAWVVRDAAEVYITDRLTSTAKTGAKSRGKEAQ